MKKHAQAEKSAHLLKEHAEESACTRLGTCSSKESEKELKINLFIV